MRYLTWGVSLLGVALFLTLAAAPAQAQATRTWVSGVGDDANPCSRTAPCKTFAGAISKTAAKGEINCLDPGGFGGVTITKSIAIICDAGSAGVLVSGTNGIIVNVTAADRVVLEGLDIEGVGTGLNGVQIVGSGTTVIRKTSIRRFAQNGVNVVGTANARVMIDDSFIANNAGGLNLQGAGGVANFGVVRNSLFENNSSFATQTISPGTLLLSGSALIGSPAAIALTAGASVISYENNVLRGTGLPTQTTPLQ